MSWTALRDLLKAVIRIGLFAFAISLHNFPERMAAGESFAGGEVNNGASVATRNSIRNNSEEMTVAISLLTTGHVRTVLYLIGLLTGLAGGLFSNVAIEYAGRLML
jgi:zinc transporter, ZIP family